MVALLVDPAIASAVSGPARLSVGSKTVYGAGQLVEGVVLNAVNVFLFFYATAVRVLAGAALSLGLVIDVVADPLRGSWSDAWRGRLGRRLPFMLAGVLPWRSASA